MKRLVLAVIVVLCFTCCSRAPKEFLDIPWGTTKEQTIKILEQKNIAFRESELVPQLTFLSKFSSLDSSISLLFVNDKFYEGWAFCPPTEISSGGIPKPTLKTVETVNGLVQAIDSKYGKKHEYSTKVFPKEGVYDIYTWTFSDDYKIEISKIEGLISITYINTKLKRDESLKTNRFKEGI